MTAKRIDVGIAPKHPLGATPCVQRTLSATVLIAVTICTLGGATSPADGLRFTSPAEGQYVFDTGILRGELRQGDRTLGLTSVVHVPSGTRLDGTYGIFSYYRVFTTNKRYAHAAWEWPCISKLLPDGAVQIFWPAEDERPIEMSATYRISGPAAIDLETAVKAQKDLPQFEVFLASYFRQTFTVPCVYVAESPETGGKPGLMTAKKSLGDWQMFPKDSQVLPLIRDGRWKLEPNPVQWVIMPCMEAPVGIRHSAAASVADVPPAIRRQDAFGTARPGWPRHDLTAVLMAPPEDCFAISTPYEGEGHYSMYLSLFGGDIRAGQTAKARTRLVIAAGASDVQILDRYKEYMKGLK